MYLYGYSLEAPQQYYTIKGYVMGSYIIGFFMKKWENYPQIIKILVLNKSSDTFIGLKTLKNYSCSNHKIDQPLGFI